MWRGKVSAAIIVAVILASWPISPASAGMNIWQKGATIWPQAPTELSSSGYKDALKKWKNLGGDYVSLTVNTYQKNQKSNEIIPGYNTPTDSSLVDGIKYAHSLGLNVNLKLHHDVVGFSVWRALITPTDRELWYKNYGDMLLKYGKIASANNVEMITIGTEMINMASAAVDPKNTGYWKKYISDLRKFYEGQLTYSANWGESGWNYEVGNIEFWDDLDFIGISAYHHLTNTHSYTPASLLAKWKQWDETKIRPVHRKYNKPVIFTEVGYRSTDGALIRPPRWTSEGYVDEQEQADGYQALFQYWTAQPYMQGVHIWHWESSAEAGGAINHDFTPQNKIAEHVIESWFKHGQTPKIIPRPPAPAAVSSKIEVTSPSTPTSVPNGAFQLKALLGDKSFSSYDMYWQVDRDRLNPMYDSESQKEAWLDVSGWNWKGKGPYRINFVAKDKAGNVIDQKEIIITIAR